MGITCVVTFLFVEASIKSPSAIVVLGFGATFEFFYIDTFDEWMKRNLQSVKKVWVIYISSVYYTWCYET